MSINYYNKNAKSFIDRTINIDISTLANEFLSLVVDKGRILDLGCGSGRDSLYFMNKGFEVYAIDGSEVLVDHAKNELGINVQLATFEGYETTMTFDGLWACASLLHVPEDHMVEVVRKYRDLLNDGACFFMSFKKYPENFTLEDRSFTCYEADSLEAMINKVGGLEIVKMIETESAKVGHEDECWISAFCLASASGK